MRRFLLTVLALGGVGCALVVTASSTMAQARDAGMNGLVPAALVGLLEVVNVAGTWTWITDRRPRVQVEAAVGVLLASAVTAVCGARTYGPLGLVAPLGLLAAVHLVSRMWTVPATVEGSAVGAPEVAELEQDVARGPVVGADGPVVGGGDRLVAAAAPVRLDQQDDRRRPRVAASSTSAGRGAPTEDRAA